MRLTNPTGEFPIGQIKEYLQRRHGEKWQDYLKAWQKDRPFWEMLLAARAGDTLSDPFGRAGMFRHWEGYVEKEEGYWKFERNFEFTDSYGVDSLLGLQGHGPYTLYRPTAQGNPFVLEPHVRLTERMSFRAFTGLEGASWEQPIFDYSSGSPRLVGRRVSIYQAEAPSKLDPVAGPGISWGLSQLGKYLAPLRVALGKVAPVLFTWRGTTYRSRLVVIEGSASE